MRSFKCILKKLPTFVLVYEVLIGFHIVNSKFLMILDLSLNRVVISVGALAADVARPQYTMSDHHEARRALSRDSPS